MRLCYVLLTTAALLLGAALVPFLASYLPYLRLSLAHSLPGFLLPSPHNATAKLSLLHQLTGYPLLGSFFWEQKIAELVLLSRYNQTMRESAIAVQDAINQRSFSIWYHKAMAECLLKELAACEDSLSKASLYSNQYTHLYVQQIYEIHRKYSLAQTIEQKVTQLQLEQEALSTKEIVATIAKQLVQRHTEEL